MGRGWFLVLSVWSAKILKPERPSLFQDLEKFSATIFFSMLLVCTSSPFSIPMIYCFGFLMVS
jgi:hypothetical protein